MNLLSLYKKALDQKVNRSKTTIFFSKSTAEDLKTIIKSILGIQEVHQYEKYLGLPSVGVRRRALIILKNGSSKSSKNRKESFFPK